MTARMPNQRRNTRTNSTRVIQFKVTPEEYLRYHELCVFRGKTLSDLARGLLESDLRKATREGLRSEIPDLIKTLMLERAKAKRAKG